MAPSESDDSVALGGNWSVADAVEATVNPDTGAEVQSAAQVDVDMEGETPTVSRLADALEADYMRECAKDGARPGGGEPAGSIIEQDNEAATADVTEALGSPSAKPGGRK